MGDDTLTRAAHSEARGNGNGNGSKDPSPNVLDLVSAAMQRQDDLREAATKREDDLRILTTRHLEAMTALRSAHSAEVMRKESERLDAIRLVDTGAVTRAAEVSALQAQTLATSQATIAETLRGQVQAAATATASALATALAPITKAIEDLRQAQYQQQGEKAQAIDMRSDPIIAAIKELQVSNAEILERRNTEAVSATAIQQRAQWSTGIVVAIALSSFTGLMAVAGLVIEIIRLATGHG
jgi:hypothetical protein